MPRSMIKATSPRLVKPVAPDPFAPLERVYDPLDVFLRFLEEFRRGAPDQFVWLLTDTEGKISVANRRLICAGGKAIPAFEDPVASGPQITAGEAASTLVFELTFSGFGAAGNGVQVGADSTRPVVVNLQPGFLVSSGTVTVVWRVGTALTCVTLVLGVSYLFKVNNYVSTNALWSYSADGGSHWIALFQSNYIGRWTPGYDNKDAVWTSRGFAIYKDRPAQIELGGTFTASNVPVLGLEQAVGNLTVGMWYQITATQVNHFYVGCAIGDTFLATAATALDVNNKVQAITLSSMLDVKPTASINGWTQGAITSVNNQVGICWVNDPTNPTEGLFAYYDQNTGAVRVDKLTTLGGWVNVINVVSAYLAGNVINLGRAGISIILFYKNGVIAGVPNVSDDSLQDLRYFGAFRPKAGDIVTSIIHYL